LSLLCLKDCLDALRLISVGLLSPASHQQCRGECEVSCINTLSTRIADYVNELSRVLFKSERRDKHCWLSIFFSLYIQSFVRHGLLVIDRHMNPPELQGIPSDPHGTKNYLHLAATLFGAVSSQFDPVFPGLSADPRAKSPIPEHLQAYVAQARTVCLVEASYFEGAVATAFEFLRVLLQIGAPDFDQEDLAWGPMDLVLAPSTVQSTLQTENSEADVRSMTDSACFSNDQMSVTGDFTFEGPLVPSTGAGAASLSCRSGQSSESLSTTFVPSLFSFEVQSPLAASFADYASTCSISSSLIMLPSMQSLRPYMEIPPPSYATRPLPPLPVRRSSSPVEGEDEPVHICDCCPKRAKVFDTAEELQ
jgi:hypothetical protein